MADRSQSPKYSIIEECQGDSVEIEDLSSPEEEGLVGRNQLGLLNGVVIPCLLNILGVILFLRLGWAVGQAGIAGVAAFFAIAELQAVITVLSLTAMVTNGSMRGGGSYFMISRSLGPELGGAIGVLFYFAYAIGTCFYVIGFATALHSTYFAHYQSNWFVTICGSIVLFALMIVSLIGAKFFTKFNVLFFTLQFGSMFYAMISLWTQTKAFDLETFGRFTGMSLKNFKDNFFSSYSVSPQCGNSHCDFRKVYAVIFPAVTGIMEGANLSGDLKDPRRVNKISSCVDTLS